MESGKNMPDEMPDVQILKAIGVVVRWRRKLA
jgi:hypothetical protein